MSECGLTYIDLESEDPLPDSISQEAAKAVITFREVCCQHTTYISGHEYIESHLELVQAGDGSAHDTAQQQMRPYSRRISRLSLWAHLTGVSPQRWHTGHSPGHDNSAGGWHGPTAAEESGRHSGLFIPSVYSSPYHIMYTSVLQDYHLDDREGKTVLGKKLADKHNTLL